jgi:nucleoporin SEH1
MSTHTNILPLSHQDLLTSLAFNYYGDRLLTTSADHTIRISSLDSSTGTWSEDESGSFKAHDGVVNKAVWAHPEFGGGGVIASAGMDGSVRVWEEVNGGSSSRFGPVAAGSR